MAVFSMHAVNMCLATMHGDDVHMVFSAENGISSTYFGGSMGVKKRCFDGLRLPSCRVGIDRGLLPHKLDTEGVLWCNGCGVRTTWAPS